ncbi:MAG: NADH:flavin oxidoreductase [Halothermotrichaceae bacterium]
MTNLLSSLKIKDLELTNRIVMPPMANELADKKGYMNPEHIEHYLGRPEVGLIIVEHSYINLEGKASPNQLGIYKDEQIPGLKELVDAVHKAGNKIGIQINHAGSGATSRDIRGARNLAPSAVRHPGRENNEIPERLSVKQMEKIKKDFVQAAIRAKKAGFDMVEVHGAHGYLLNQFISPLTNQRNDNYGGSLENRSRFPLEVVEAVRNVLGKDYPLFFRLGCDDFLPDGLTVEDGIKIAPKLAAAGVDVIDLTGGLRGYEPAGNEEGFFVYLAEAIKPVTDAYILITGGIKTADFASKIVEENKTDLVGVGRALLKDKLWAKKAVEIL